MKSPIGPGHFIFAGIFALVFIVIIAWMYRKDIHMHRRYYRGSIWVLLTVIGFLFLFFLIKSRFIHL